MSFRSTRVLSFESRRAAEMAQLIRISGGEPEIAPSLVEVPLEENEAAFRFADRLFAGEYDMMILLTGVGTRLLHKVLATRYAEDQFAEALRGITTVVRGPKPASVLREWGVPITVFVPEPNTWREVLTEVAGRPEQRVAVQEYGRRSKELLDGLAAQGRSVETVPVYQWALPEDVEPLRTAVAGLSEGRYGVVMFTTSVQLEHLLRVAEEQGKTGAVLEGLRRTFVVSIGPTCSETLREHGVEPSLEPSHPKMGVMVQEAARAFGAKSN